MSKHYSEEAWEAALDRFGEMEDAGWTVGKLQLKALKQAGDETTRYRILNDELRPAGMWLEFG